MSKFNKADTKTAKPSARATSPIVTKTTRPDTRTHEGGPGYTRDARSELFLAVVGAFVAEDSFYETGDARLDRVRQLTHTVALEQAQTHDGLIPVGMLWLTDFVRWLRGEGNIRTAAIVIAAEAVAAWVEAGRKTSTKMPARARALVSAAIRRADEPGELLAYWMSRYGRPVPNSIKRGLADAVEAQYSEYSLLKYDTSKAGVRFGDVIGLARPVPKDDRQAALFRHAIERARTWSDGEKRAVPDSLAMLHARQQLEAVPVAARRALVTEKHGVSIVERLKTAGATWEYLSGWLADGKGMDAAAWEAVIPSMGYMARLRNLANFDKAGVSTTVKQQVAAYLADPAEVAKSRQLPMRFLSAYKAVEHNLQWVAALEQALTASLSNVPTLPGRSLILVDLSGSMFYSMSQKAKLYYWELAAIFGVALARRAEHADLVRFGSSSSVVTLKPGQSVLHAVRGQFGNSMGGTETGSAVARHYKPGYHDRVIIVTDEQASSRWGADPASYLSVDTPLYTWNLAGYSAGHAPSGSGNRHTFGGLSDAAFRMIPLIEAGQHGTWPWEKTGG